MQFILQSVHRNTLCYYYYHHHYIVHLYSPSNNKIISPVEIVYNCIASDKKNITLVIFRVKVYKYKRFTFSSKGQQYYPFPNRHRLLLFVVVSALRK